MGMCACAIMRTSFRRVKPPRWHARGWMARHASLIPKVDHPHLKKDDNLVTTSLRPHYDLVIRLLMTNPCFCLPKVRLPSSHSRLAVSE